MTAPQAEVLLDPAGARVFVRDRRLASSGRSFMARALACPAVTQIDYDLAAGTADIRLAATTAGFPTAVVELSAAVRSASPVNLPADAMASRQGTIRRMGARLTTWRVGSHDHHSLRFRHPRMQRDRVLARGLQRMVITLPGVHDARLSGWSSDLVIHVDPDSLDADTLLAVLQRAVDERTGQGLTSAWAMAGKTATLGLLAATDLVLPALAPVSGLLLVGGNLGTIAAAAHDLRRLRVGPATVATAIICGTLATGQFLASGIMAWSFDFWRRRHRRDMEAERLLLLEDAVPMPPRLTAHGAAEPLALPGERLAFNAWEVVPADARLVSGGGVIDERAVTGVAGCRSIRPGDHVPAGGVLLGGEGVLVIERSTEDSRVAGVVRLLAAATEVRPGRFAPTIEADRLLTQFAGPTLATAGLGLLVGDVTTAAAVLRPDYGSAEAMSLSFEDLDAVACGLGAGCLLASPRVIDDLAAVDTLVVLDHPLLGEREIEVADVETTANPAGEVELIRMAASLARHVTGPRRDALARLAAERGCVISDVVPESFGDVHGLRIVHRSGRGVVSLHEAGGPEDREPRPFLLEVDAAPRATFRFRSATVARVARGLDRIVAAGGYHLLVAGEPAVTEQLPADERLPPDEERIAQRLAELRGAGKKLAVVGPPRELARLAGARDVTISLGLGDDPGAAAGIVCLSGDVAALADLLTAVADRRRNLRTARSLSILPNAACVAGAFLFGFTSVVSAVVSNLGTLGIYRRASGGLHRRRRRHWLRQRAMLPRLAGHATMPRRTAS